MSGGNARAHHRSPKRGLYILRRWTADRITYKYEDWVSHGQDVATLPHVPALTSDTAPGPLWADGLTVDTAFDPAAQGFTGGLQITSADNESKFRYESAIIPDYVELFVKTFAIRQITIQSVTGTFSVGNTITKGSGSDTTTAVIRLGLPSTYSIETCVLESGLNQVCFLSLRNCVIASPN